MIREFIRNVLFVCGVLLWVVCLIALLIASMVTAHHVSFGVSTFIWFVGSIALLKTVSEGGR